MLSQMFVRAACERTQCCLRVRANNKTHENEAARARTTKHKNEKTSECAQDKIITKGNRVNTTKCQKRSRANTAKDTNTQNRNCANTTKEINKTQKRNCTNPTKQLHETAHGEKEITQLSQRDPN